jgi:alkylhydroperoxidase family enzyme
MSRIPTPAAIEAAPAASRPLLQAVKKQFGIVPNLFRLVSSSPAALEGYVGLSGALGKGALPVATHERIALAVAEINGCGYCVLFAQADSPVVQQASPAGPHRQPGQGARP